MKVESGEDLQHYHLRRGVHSRSLQAPQVCPSRAFAMPPSSSVLIQFDPEFAMLPCACAGSLKAPRDLTSLPLRSFSMHEQYRMPGISFGWILVRLGYMSICQGWSRAPLCGERESQDWEAGATALSSWRLSARSFNKQRISGQNARPLFCPPALLAGILNSITTGLYTSLWPRDSKTLRRGGRVYSRRGTKYLSWRVHHSSATRGWNFCKLCMWRCGAKISPKTVCP